MWVRKSAEYRWGLLRQCGVRLLYRTDDVSVSAWTLALSLVGATHIGALDQDKLRVIPSWQFMASFISALPGVVVHSHYSTTFTVLCIVLFYGSNPVRPVKGLETSSLPTRYLASLVIQVQTIVTLTRHTVSPRGNGH